MVLVDTSIWVDHLRSGHPHLTALLIRNAVSAHPWIVGEIACGNIQNRAEVLKRLRMLPPVTVAREDEVLFFIEKHQLMGKGIGYIDAHLVAAAIAQGLKFWTRDKRLIAAVGGLGILYVPPVI